MALFMTCALLSHRRARVGVGSSAKRIKDKYSSRRYCRMRALQRWPAANGIAERVLPLEAGGDTGSRVDVRRGRGCRQAFECDPRQRGVRIMTLLPPGVKVQLAFGFIDARNGIARLAT